MNISNDKCPFCGAEPAGLLDFGCGTGTPSLALHPNAEEPQWIRSNDCKDRQIAQLKERLNAWRELVPCISPCLDWQGDQPSVSVYFEKSSLEKLRRLGEI